MKTIPYKKRKLPAEWIPGFNPWLKIIRAERQKCSVLAISDFVNPANHGHVYEASPISDIKKRFDKPFLETIKQILK